MTYRERREAKADKLVEWAAKREAKAEAVFAAGEPMRSDWAFITQPGHIPERARLIAREDRAYESPKKAGDMSSRASGIESQLAASIYDDDPDAVERLTERVALLEARREQYKAENVAYRKAHKAELAAMTAYERSQAVPHPSYEITNLGGNITRNRDRLAGLRRRVARAERSEDAGGVLVERHGGIYCSVTFAEKPDRSVLDALKADGFRWQKGSWYGEHDRLPSCVTQ